MQGYDCAWNEQRVLREAMAVGQDPDCRGQVSSFIADYTAVKSSRSSQQIGERMKHLFKSALKPKIVSMVS